MCTLGMAGYRYKTESVLDHAQTSKESPRASAILVTCGGFRRPCPVFSNILDLRTVLVSDTSGRPCVDSACTSAILVTCGHPRSNKRQTMKMQAIITPSYYPILHDHLASDKYFTSTLLIRDLSKPSTQETVERSIHPILHDDLNARPPDSP